MSGTYAPSQAPAAKRARTTAKPSQAPGVTARATPVRKSWGKKKAAPKRKTAQRRVDPLAAHRFHDAMSRGDNPLPVPSAIGSFVTVPSVARGTINTGTGHAMYLIVQWNASEVRGIAINGNTRQYSPLLSCGQLSQTVPQSIRPLAMSLRLRNTSVYTATSGVVRILSIPEQISWGFDGQDKIALESFNAITGLVESHNATRSYTGAEFVHNRAVVLPPAARQPFGEYVEFKASTSTPLQATLQEGSVHGCMNCCVVAWSPTTAQPNSWDISLHCQDAARYPADSGVLNVLARPARATVSEATFNAGVQRVQASASSAMQLEDWRNGIS